MGKIAQDMGKLAEDIARLKTERIVQMAEIAAKTAEIRAETNSMLNEFAQNRRAQAKFDRNNRINFVTNLITDVGEMLEEFNISHSETTKSERAKRKQSVKDIKEEVHQKLDEFAVEMSDMRSAWEGEKSSRKTARRTSPAAVKSDRAEISVTSAASRISAPLAAKFTRGDLLSVLADEFGMEMKQRPSVSKVINRRRRR